MKNKTLKSVCALLLAAMLVCTGLFLQAFAQTIEELYTYTKFGDGIMITKYNGNETELVLPREIDGFPVMYLDADWLPEAVAENVTAITLPNTLYMVFDSAFSVMPKLQAMYVEEGNPYFYAENGILFETRNGVTTLLVYPATKGDAHYTIPDGVQIVGGFWSNPHLQTVTVPEGVQTLLVDAFYNCTALTQIKLPRSLKYIQSYAFDGCTALTTVWFSNSLPNSGGVRISPYAFDNCTALKEVFLPDDAYTFGQNVFPNNENLVLYGNGQSGAAETVKGYAGANGHTFQDIHIQLRIAYETRNGRLTCAYDKAPLYLFAEKICNQYTDCDQVTVTAFDVDGLELTDLQAPIADGVTFLVDIPALGYALYYVYNETAVGDVNRDGNLNAVDARYVLQAASGARELTDADKRIADLNGDGKVNAVDARWILQIASGSRTI
ncbi:MAG: leucine-rich repeat protein [Candidatus Fimenecus sp.]